MARNLLQLLVVIAALVLAGCSHPDDAPGPTPTTQAPPTPTPAAPATPTPVPGPGPYVPNGTLDFISSENGRLDVKLLLENATIVVNGREYVSTVYNGKLITPVWRLQRGDVLQVDLHDEVFVTNDPANFTNIHFHGLNVPPTPPGDNVFIQVYPNGTNVTAVTADAHGHGAHGADPGMLGVGVYRYAIIIPEDHPAGLFWWHAHPHGVSNPQVRGGMSGAMVIGDIAKEHFPEVAYDKERVLLFRDFANATKFGPSILNEPPQRTLNGVLGGTLNISPGERQFWRMANTGANLDFNLTLVNETNATVPFYVMAVDGNVLERIEERTSLFLHPGARMEAFVVGPPAGNYTLRHVESLKNVAVPNKGGNRGGAVFEPTAAIAVVVSGPGEPPAAALALADLPAKDMDRRFLELRKWILDGKPTRARGINFTVENPQNGSVLGIDNKSYDPRRNDTNVTFGDIEVWTLGNPTNAPHVFHIHQLDFLVLDVNGTKGMAHGLQDTVLVPPWGQAKIAIPFTAAHTIGRFVYHCHYLAHEDAGMMANIVVGGDAGP